VLNEINRRGLQRKIEIEIVHKIEENFPLSVRKKKKNGNLIGCKSDNVRKLRTRKIFKNIR
jgi:hypothetical protein